MELNGYVCHLVHRLWILIGDGEKAAGSGGKGAKKTSPSFVFFFLLLPRDIHALGRLALAPTSTVILFHLAVALRILDVRRRVEEG